MTKYELEGDKLYRIIIPSLARDNTEIPTETRNKVIKSIFESFINANGGARIFLGIGGWYSDKNGYVVEAIISIESHGQNPFSDEYIADISEVLNQEVVMYEEISGRKAYLVDRNKEASEYPKRVSSEDGSFFVIFEPETRNGKQRFFVLEFDDSGDLLGAGEYSEQDFFESEPIPEEVESFMQEQVEQYLSEAY